MAEEKILNLILDKIDERTGAIFEQTAELSEFRTEVNLKLNSYKKDFKFIEDKLLEHEKEIYKLKHPDDNEKEINWG